MLRIFGPISIFVFSWYTTIAQSGDSLSYGIGGDVGVDVLFLEHIVDSIAEAAIAKRAFPGMQVLVARKGQVVFHKAYGHHTYDSIRPVRLTDIYDLASITKISSGLPALMVLAGQGKFDLDGTLGDYLPEFRGSNKEDLSWRQILAHNARLEPWIPYWRSTVKKNGKFKSRTFSNSSSKKYPTAVTDSLYLHYKYRKKIFKAIRKSPLNEEPGYVYSGLSFYLQPEMIERLTGQEFERYLKETIFQPIGANSITYNPLRFYGKDRIIPTERDTFFRMTQIHGRVHDEGAAMMAGVSCNAGLFSTAFDLARLGQLYLNKGYYGGQQIINAEIVEEFTRCQYCDEGNYRGLGFDKSPWTVDSSATSLSISDFASAESYGHSGYTGTLIWVDPKEELIFVFLSNRVYQTRLNRKIYTEDVRPSIHRAIHASLVD